MFPSDPVATAPSVVAGRTVEYSTTVVGLAGEIRAIRFALWVTQRFPSGPAVRYCRVPVVVKEDSDSTPAVVIRPICLVLSSVNQSAPSGPAVMSRGREIARREYSDTAPAGVIRPTFPCPMSSVNQRLP